MAMSRNDGGLFISYRRQDSAAYAARLADTLVARYGRDRLFLDIDNLELGVDFASHIHRVIESCRTILVVIGPKWTEVRDSQGQRRIDDPSDFIRAEVASALRSDRYVIPVLVGGARMPRADELPEELAALSRRNAFELRDDRWASSIDQLCELLDRVLGAPKAPRAAPRSASFLHRLAAAFNVLRGLETHDAQAQVRATAARPAASMPADAVTPLHAAKPVAAADREDAPPPQVFVSYASEDAAIADQIVGAIEESGRSCWIAHRNLTAGTPSWSGAIVGAIANSHVVVVLVSARSVTSKQVLREVTLADDEDIPLLPLCIDDTPLSKDLRYFFSSAQRLDAYRMPWDQALQQVVSSVAHTLSRP